MPCVHSQAVDWNGAIGTSGRRRCKVPDSLGSERRHRVRIEEQNPTEVSLPQLHSRHPPKKSHNGDSRIRKSAGYESSDLQSLDVSTAEAEEAELARTEMAADLYAAAPEFKMLRCQEESLQAEDPRYDSSGDFSPRDEFHPDHAGSLLHQTAWSACDEGSQAYKLALEIKDCLDQSEVQMRVLRKERDNAVHDLMNLSGKITNCTAMAEEQAKLLEEQSETIRKLETKIQMLEEGKQEMVLEQMKEMENLEHTAQQLRTEIKEKTQVLEDANQLIQVECTGHEENIKTLVDTNHRLREEQDAIRNKLRSCEDLNQRLKFERDTYVENTGRLEDMNHSLRDEREAYIEEISIIEDNNRVMRAEQKDYGEELHTMEEKNQHLQYELQKYKEAMEVFEVEEKLQVLEHNHQVLQFREKEFQEKIQGLEDHNHLLRLELKDYMQKLQRTEEEQQRLRTELQDAKQSMRRLENKHQCLQCENNELKESMRRLENRHQCLQCENNELKENHEANHVGLKAQHIQEIRSVEENKDRIHSERKKKLEEGMELMESKHKEKMKIIQNNKHQLKKEIVVLEERMKDLRAKHKCDLTKFKSNKQEMEDHYYKEVTTLKNCIEDMGSRHSEERAAFKEQLCLHEQRAVIQHEKIKVVLQKLSVAKSELSKARTKEAELKETLEIQENVYPQKLKELRTASKALQELTGVKAELREQAETMDQLWVDNARLVQLLAESEEYQSLLKEMKEGNGLMFCPTQFKGSKFQILAQRYGALSTRGSVNPKTECELWIPADLYDLVMAFRREHSWEISIDEFHEFLGLVNRFWLEREKKHMVQTKVKYERQISAIKRHHLQRIPYQQVVRSSHSRQAGKVNASSSKVSLEGGEQEDR